jgi:HEAT repeat protein
MNKISHLLFSVFIVFSSSNPAPVKDPPEQSVKSAKFFDGPTFSTLNVAEFIQSPRLMDNLKTLQISTSEPDRFISFLAITPNFEKFDLTEKQAIIIFLAGLNDLNVAIQTHAAARLGGNGFVNNLPEESVRLSAIGPLISILKDRAHENRSINISISDDVLYGASSTGLRATIVKTLGKIGDEKAIPPLLNCLAEGNIIESAIIAIGELAKSNNLRDFPIDAVINSIKPFLMAEERNIRIEAARTLQQIDSTRTFAIIIDMLRKGKPEERAKAATIMALFSDESGRKAMLEALTDESPKVRANLLSSLSHPNFRKDNEFISLVIPFLRDPDPDVRSSAAYSLNCLTDERVVAGVMPLLKDPNAKVRASAVYTAGRCGDKRLLDQVVALLDDQNAEVRYQALHALAAMRDPSAIKPIKERMHKYPEFEWNAGGVLEQLEKLQ